MIAAVLSLLLLCGHADDPAPKLPDYEAILNDKLSKGITPETNANVLIWKALGPTPEGGKGMPAEYFKRLGIAEPPKEGEYFISLRRFAAERLKLDPVEAAGLDDQQSLVMKRPWTVKDHPHIAAWLKANEKPLAIIAEATKRRDYYNPLTPAREGKEAGYLIGALLPSVQKCREAAAAFAARAMLRLAEGKADEAWQDLLACHRLGRLVGRGGTLIEGLVGIAIDTIACYADVAFLDSAKLTSKQIQACLKDLQALPPMASVADKMDLTERYVFQNSLQLMVRDGFKLAEAGPKLSLEDRRRIKAIDWEPAIQNGNKWYDRIVAAMRLPTRAERTKECDKIETDIKALAKEMQNFEKLAPRLLANPDKTLVKAISDIFIRLLMPAFRQVQDAHDRVTQIQRNLHVAFALAAYRADNGRYPAALADLAPKYLAAIPDDLFSGKPLIYKPTEKGFLLYSVGVNGVDEGGRWADDEPRGDDLRVRLPVPESKK